jgi:hypothetical protein
METGTSKEFAGMETPEGLRFVLIEPELAAELKALLEQAGEALLAAQVDSLSIVERIDDSHGSDFYILPRPQGRWTPQHRTLGLKPGALHVDVVGDQIACIEVLRKQSDVIPTVMSTVPQGQSCDMEVAGTTSVVDESGVRRWMLVGWSKEIGWAVLADVPPFSTRAEAVAEYWRLKAIEDSTAQR